MAGQFTVRANNMFAAIVDGERTARKDDREDRRAAADLEGVMLSNEITRAKASHMVEQEILRNQQMQAQTSAILGVEARAGEDFAMKANERQMLSMNAGMMVDMFGQNRDTLIDYRFLQEQATAAGNRAFIEQMNGIVSTAANTSTSTSTYTGTGSVSEFGGPMQYNADGSLVDNHGGAYSRENLMATLVADQAAIGAPTAYPIPLPGMTGAVGAINKDAAGYTPKDYLGLFKGSQLDDKGQYVTPTGAVVPQEWSSYDGGFEEFDKFRRARNVLPHSGSPSARNMDASLLAAGKYLDPRMGGLIAEEAYYASIGANSLANQQKVIVNEMQVSPQQLNTALSKLGSQSIVEVQTPHDGTLYVYKREAVPGGQPMVSKQRPEYRFANGRKLTY